jgi:hypothetical protein
MIKQIPGYASYSVTDDGRVWSHRLRSGWMKPGVDRNGYVRYSLIGDTGKRKGMYIHQLVALAYIPNPENKPNVNHKDFNKSNNSVANLEWCTHLENVRHDWAGGNRRPLRGNQTGPQKLNEQKVRRIRNLAKLGLRQMDIAEIIGVKQPTVSSVVVRRLWGHVV